MKYILPGKGGMQLDILDELETQILISFSSSSDMKKSDCQKY